MRQSPSGFCLPHWVCIPCRPLNWTLRYVPPFWSVVLSAFSWLWAPLLMWFPYLLVIAHNFEHWAKWKSDLYKYYYTGSWANLGMPTWRSLWELVAWRQSKQKDNFRSCMHPDRRALPRTPLSDNHPLLCDAPPEYMAGLQFMFGLTNSWACELTPCAPGFRMRGDTLNDSCQCIKSAAILLETCLCCPRARTSYSRWYALLATSGVWSVGKHE